MLSTALFGIRTPWLSFSITKLHTGVYFFVSLSLHKKQMKPGLSKLTRKKRLYLSFMIYNGVHKVKSQKWNEVSITDQVTLPAESPSIFLENIGKRKIEGDSAGRV